MQTANILNIEKSDKEIKVIFPEKYRNKLWSEKFGVVQSLFREKGIYNYKIKLDFRNLTWIDPLPLLSLQIAIAELNTNQIEIYLPKIDANYGKSNKILAFFLSEGFFDNFSKKNVIFYEDQTTIITEFTKYEKLVGELQYSNCSIIKAQIEELTNIIERGTIDDWVKGLVIKSQYNIKNKVESYKAEEVISRLQRLLSEAITNVFEHAYQGIAKKYVGFYVRFRKGLANTRINGEERSILERLINEEHNNSPLLNKYFIDNIFNFIEIFVIDSGCGLSSNYFPDEEKNVLKYPFRKAWENALIKGIRGYNSDIKKTQKGGLYLISRSLGFNYICSRDENEWIGHSLPLRSEVIPYSVINSDSQVKGFSLIFRLSWDVASDDEKSWQKMKFNHSKNLKAELEKNPYYKELCNSKDIYQRFYGEKLKENITKTPIFVVDDRFEFSNERSKAAYSIDKKEVYCCIYLPERSLQKNRIIDIVNNEFCHFKCSTRSLIICDILVYEANLFQLALENAVFSQAFLNTFDNIILITQRFSVLFLNKIGKSYSNNEHLSNEYIYGVADKFSPNISLGHLIAWIRTHDSLLFWLNIKEKTDKGNLLYINNKIKWYRDSDEYDMNGYLNFAQVITDIESKKILDNALSRTMCFSDKGDGIFYSNMDLLTSQLASKMNTLFYNYPIYKNKSHIEVMIGSVHVTGLVQNNAEQNDSDLNKIPIHFFLHQYIKNTKTGKVIDNSDLKIPTLFLWPTEWLSNIRKKSGDYRRVGRSHVIAPFGWKYYPIPRYRLFNLTKKTFVNSFSEIEQNDEYEFNSAYECTPSETYNDWQIAGKQILTIGHYHYENRHDLLKIDFPLVVNTSFNEGGKLSVFLLSEFLLALGLSSNNIITRHSEFSKSFQIEKTEKSDRYLDSSLRQFIKSVETYIKSNKSEECAIIAYPSHFNTEHIIEIIKGYIDISFHDRIFPLIPINKERSGSAYLISPLILEAIKDRICSFKKDGKKAKVLLFDEAIIEGKTRKELKHLLFYLGADEINTLCVVDRRRLPFSTTDPQKHKSYWRLDIPRLGNRDNCLLCKSLDIIDSFKNFLIYSIDKIRIEQWKAAWESRFPYSISEHHGLVSKPITPFNKKFSIYIDTKTGEIKHHDTIQLTNSAGLTLYAGEIHAMTARDDMALHLCKNFSFARLTKIELLAINLLLFGKDFSYLVTKDMIEIIFKEINNSECTSNETALGALTIISQSPKIIELFINDYMNKEQTDIDVHNHDIELLLCFFAQNSSTVYAKMPTLKRHFGSKYISNIKSIYHNFHHELHNDFGKPHDTAIDDILTVLNEFSPANRDKIRGAISSCEKLEDIINLFPLWNTREFYSKEKSQELINEFRTIRFLLEQHFQNIENKLEEDNKSIIYVDYLQLYDELNILKLKIVELKKKVFQFHELLFINIGSGVKDSPKFPLKEKLEQLISNYKFEENKKVRLNNFNKKEDETQYERWIPWDKQIEKKVNYIINNVKHSKGYIGVNNEYYEKNLPNQDLANMLVTVKYTTENLLIIFENFSEKSNEEISITAKAKNKPEKQHIIDLGGIIRYDGQVQKSGLYLIQTIIELPYQ